MHGIYWYPLIPNGIHAQFRFAGIGYSVQRYDWYRIAFVLPSQDGHQGEGSLDCEDNCLEPQWLVSRTICFDRWPCGADTIIRYLSISFTVLCLLDKKYIHPI